MFKFKFNQDSQAANFTNMCEVTISDWINEDLWIDSVGQMYPPATMSDTHLRIAIEILEQNAALIQQLLLKDVCDNLHATRDEELFEGVMAQLTITEELDVIMNMFPDVWIRTAPIYRSLQAEVTRRGISL